MKAGESVPSVAVVVLVWNGIEFLKKFLPSWVSTTYPGATIYVADNASSDGSADYVETNFPNVRVIRLPFNGGFALGYNMALDQIEADYFVLLNQDVEVEPGWLEPMVECIQNQPDAGICQPKILSYHQRDHYEYAGAGGGFLDLLGYPFCRGRIFEAVEKDSGQYETIIPIAWASGAALMIKADLYALAGGLDDDFFAHMEEIDLCWRCRLMGSRIYVVPQSKVWHVGGGSLPQGNPKKTFLNFRNNLFLIIKNLSLGQLLWILPVRLVLDWIAAIRCLPYGLYQDFLAILKAQLEVLWNFPNLVNKRKFVSQIKKTNSDGSIPASLNDGIFKGSIVWNYFVLGKQTFDRLF